MNRSSTRTGNEEPVEARHRPRRLRLLAAAAAAGAAVIVVGVAGGGQALLSADCSLRAMRPIRLGASSFVLASDGSLLGSVPAARDREPLPLSRISPWVRRATVAIEDRRFYQHGGLDYRAILRAGIADLLAGRIVQGGSTIEQELARNLYLGNDPRTVSWKLEQACLATRIAARWPRPRILDAYLNQVFYGERAYGVAAASYTYFGRPPGRLPVADAALLAGLPQAPSRYDPLVHPDAARARRGEVLHALLETGALSRSAYRWASSRPLGVRPGSRYARLGDPTFTGAALRQLTARLGRRPAASGGLRIETTLAPRLQAAGRRSIRSVLRTRGDPAAALVAIDPRTGAVRALTAYQPGRRRTDFDLATDARRQAGSAFKPFALAAALEHGDSLWSTFAAPSSTLIADRRCDTGTRPWLVHDYADESFGTLDLGTATADSVNTVFAQLVDRIGPASVVRVARRLGISSRLQPVCSIALGTQPVTPLELTSAYATLAAGGVHHDPTTIAAVRGPHGRVLLRAHTGGRRALPARVAAQVTRALEGVIRHGTGTAAAIGRPAAGKTGTAENEQDAWFCGYVPQLAACVWVGFPAGEIPMHDVEGLPAVVGGSLPAEIWHGFMTRALAGVPVARQPRSSGWWQAAR